MLLDSSAWIEYFQGTKKGEQVRDVLDRTAVIYSAPTVLAEVFSKFARSTSVAEAERQVDFILKNSAFIETTRDIGLAAGTIHAETKARVPDFGMADAFILAAARARKTRVLSKDAHFADFADADLL